MTEEPRGGRRAARRRPRPGHPALVAVVLVLLAGVAVLLVRTPPEERTGQQDEGTLVDRTQLVCPDDAERASRTSVRLGLAPVEGVGAGGTLRAGPSGGTERLTLDRGGTVDVGGRGLEVDASGEVAAGVFGHVTVRDPQALAVGACVAPRASWWFAGPGADLDHASALWLTNVDPGPAVVDVRVLSDTGEVDTVGTRGITLAPGETRRLALAETAPGNSDVVVAVEASRGRVAAAVDDRLAARPAAVPGREWLPGGPAPARTVRVAGLRSGPGRHELVIGNPGDFEALVDLELSGSRGSFVPTGAETVAVPPGAVRVVDLTDLLPRGETVALRIRSRVPVVAAARSVGTTDFSHAPAVLPLTGPAVVPAVTGTRAELGLTAGSGTARVRLSVRDEQGRQLASSSLDLPAGATTGWPLPRDAGYVLVTPVEGSVHGAVGYADGSASSALPVTALPLRIDLPLVRPGPR